MILLNLAIKSIRNRIYATTLTALSIALSTTLLLSVERTKRGTQDGFTQAISQTDLLVGGRTGPVNLILYTVFNMGSASNNISRESYQHFQNHPSVEWTIPYSLGDGHRGFRVVATDENFYQHYRFKGDQKVELAEGVAALDIWDVAIGSDVATKLQYHLGDKIIIAHGVTRSEGVQLHSDKPFHVSGILKPTGTALDQSVYISLYGMEAIHLDWKNGAAPDNTHSIPAENISKSNIKLGPITAFFLRTKSRLETLSLQREINTFAEEPLLAIIPGATLAELWRALSQIDNALKVISWMVLAVGIAAMLSSLLSGLNERRREMAILRSLGAKPSQIMMLLVIESSILTAIGIGLGLVTELTAFRLLQTWLENQFGLLLVGPAVTYTEVTYLAVILLIGTLAGLIPATMAARNALKDGLSVKL